MATALVAWSGTCWPVALYAAGLSALTALAVWAGPETYQDSITVDNSTDRELQSVAMPVQA